MHTQIERLIQLNQVPHTLLFAGSEGSGKKETAFDLARILLQSSIQHHPDLHIYIPDSSGKMHSIEAMRRLIEEVYMAPFNAKVKVFILEEADRMLPTSSNALLKTLEEPPMHSYLILLTTSPESILTTILSRVRKFIFHPKIKSSLERTTQRDCLVQLLNHKMGYAEFIKKAAIFDEGENSEKVLEEILFWHRDRYLLSQGGDMESCYFKAYKEELIRCTLPLCPLEQIFDRVEKMRFALQQHVKLRTILEFII